MRLIEDVALASTPPTRRRAFAALGNKPLTTREIALREEQCGRSAYAPARSGDHRNTTHRCYLHLGPRGDGKHTG